MGCCFNSACPSILLGKCTSNPAGYNQSYLLIVLFRWVYQELRQSFIDMEAMFELRDTKPGVVDSPYAIDYDSFRDGTKIEFINTGFAYRTAPPSITEGVSTNGEIHHEEELVGSRPILKGTSFTIPQGATVAIGACPLFRLFGLAFVLF